MRCIAGKTLRVLYGPRGFMIPNLGACELLKGEFVGMFFLMCHQPKAWSGLFEEGLRSAGEESRLPCGCHSLPEL